jgi:hypothetical protein
MISRYAETYTAWQRDPLNFWAEAAKEIDWIQAPQNIFDAKAGVYGRWSPMPLATPVGMRWIAMWWLGRGTNCGWRHF